MALTSIIRFKVTPKLQQRAKRVLRLRNAGKANPETLSDVGREWFFARLQEEERALGILPEPAPTTHPTDNGAEMSHVEHKEAA